MSGETTRELLAQRIAEAAICHAVGPEGGPSAVANPLDVADAVIGFFFAREPGAGAVLARLENGFPPTHPIFERPDTQEAQAIVGEAAAHMRRLICENTALRAATQELAAAREALEAALAALDRLRIAFHAAREGQPITNLAPTGVPEVDRLMAALGGLRGALPTVR